mmetsp:Transcript_40561/g.107198  ORF Transcript_40561/g.107198 Transcript_40561/m.107198 type:complete len:84 (-) Transcript_40561:486-737(-)
MSTTGQSDPLPDLVIDLLEHMASKGKRHLTVPSCRTVRAQHHPCDAAGTAESQHQAASKATTPASGEEALRSPPDVKEIRVTP